MDGALWDLIHLKSRLANPGLSKAGRFVSPGRAGHTLAERTDLLLRTCRSCSPLLPMQQALTVLRSLLTVPAATKNARFWLSGTDLA